MDYRGRITIEPGKRSGKPCIRGLRITVYDILDYLASGIREDEILADFPVSSAGREVHLAVRDKLEGYIRPEAERDAVYAF